MKRLKTLSLVLFIMCVAFNLNVKAQDSPVVEQIKKILSKDDLKRLDDANNLLKSAEDNLAGYEKVMSEKSSINKKMPKAKRRDKKKMKVELEKLEPKGADYLTKAIKNYEDGYNAKYNVYITNIKKAKLKVTGQDLTDGEDAEKSANKSFEESKDKRSKVSNEKTDSGKSKVMSDANESVQNAISQLEFAFELYFNSSSVTTANEDKNKNNTVTPPVETPKKDASTTDNGVTNAGTNVNQAQVNQPQNTNPSNQQVTEPTKTNTSNMFTPVKGIVFKIQFIATRRELNKQQLDKIYKTTEIINTKLDGNLYKYSIGNFASYSEAKKFRDGMGVRDAFVIALKDGNKISIVEAIQQTQGGGGK